MTDVSADKSNYERIKTSFELPVPASFNFARDVIDTREDPSAPAIHWLHGDEEKRVSYRDLSLVSKRIATGLGQLGLGKGDTVIVLLGRKLAWWETVTACLRMGAVVSPATAQLSASDLEYRINAAAACCVIADADNRTKIEAVAQNCPGLRVKVLAGAEAQGWTPYRQLLQTEAAAEATADTLSSDEALCFFTSGTTGKPKMTVHTQASYGIAHTITGRFWLDQKPDDLHWNISDTGWAKAAWSSFFGPFICGSCVFVDDADFNPRRTLELLQRYPITTMCGAPTIYRMLVQQDLDGFRPASLRHCVAAGEPLNPEVIDTWREHTGITVRDGYGQTETVLLCGNFPGMEIKPGSMGKPSPGFDLAVIGHDGEPKPPNVEGDIAIRVKPERPVGLFKAYRKAPEATAATFRGDWYITGDRACVDEDGYFWFVGRADDVIISSGYRIGPFEVESILLEHDAVAESAVVSSPDETRGEVVKAFVVLSAGHSASDALATELQQYVKSMTAPYKYPRKIEFVDALPKTVSGKIRRKELREREWQQAH